MLDYKKPCANCPFRKSQAGSYRLGGQRVREIFYADAFECHKTTGVASKKKPMQQCVGLIALQDSEDKHNTFVQLAIRLLGYDPGVIDTSDTFETLAEAIKAHGGDR